MLIDKIILKDFRIYQGTNEISFLHNPDKNVTIIAGNNGYGKTTFLTALVWCFYGKLMVDVDERFKREVYESGGYKRFCQKAMNRATPLNPKKESLQSKLEYYRGAEAKKIKDEIDDLNSFQVRITISDIFIPSVPCNRLEVSRTFNIETEEESVQILIDGRENELTREVGHEIFIHDFIMPKEIAKFFFFDAEKIVSLAEIRSVDEKRELSRAYTEVLGIKKYEDLKANLENIRFRLRNSKATDKDRDELESINQKILKKKTLEDHYRTRLEGNKENLAARRQEAERLQEKLIREGSTISAEEFKDLKLLRENTSAELRDANQRFKDFLELAPFAIAANKLSQISEYLLLEEENHAVKHSSEFFKEKIKSIENEIDRLSDEINLSKAGKTKLREILESQLLTSGDKDFKPLLEYTSEQTNQFRALKDNIQNSYAERFKTLVKDMKLKQSSLSILNSKLSDAETKENDLVIREIRKDKTKLEDQIRAIEDEIIEDRIKLETTINELKNLGKRQSELAKKVGIADVDALKDETAANLIGELTRFLTKLKNKKKESLESKILVELQTLMHKQNFISRVEVILEDDILDIEFYDDQDQVINKDGLSKGEQQLYATALLKALVDESNIKFPIFIDSPLQKFDQKHANNIIKDFYPSISEQVILLPLLEKELTQSEYKGLYPRVSKAYRIYNMNKDQSYFQECRPSELFNPVISNIHV